MNKDILIKTLVTFYMDNPDLGNEIDYKSDQERLKYYNRSVKKLKKEDILKELSDLEIEIPNSINFMSN